MPCPRCGHVCALTSSLSSLVMLMLGLSEKAAKNYLANKKTSSSIAFFLAEAEACGKGDDAGIGKILVSAVATKVDLGVAEEAKRYLLLGLWGKPLATDP